MTPRPPSRRLAAAWLREVGLDWYLRAPSAPVPGPAERSAPKAPPAGAAAASTGAASRAPRPAGGGDDAKEGTGQAAADPPGAVRERAASAATLEELREAALSCRACPLCKGARQVVFGTGNPRARLLFVGEGPGEEEDLQGEPFVGRAGKLLDRWIGRIGLSREDVYIANVVKCRPPANRAPEPAEAAACLPWLLAQVRLIRPEVICTLGNTPLRHFLGVPEGITRARGKWVDREGIPVLPTYHPAYVLRNPRAEGEVLADFDLLAERLGIPGK